MQKTRIIGYVRVSTEDQRDNGVSLDAQLGKIKAYCDLYDIELVNVYIESKSAKNLDRPELRKAIDTIKRGDADGLLVTKLDRLTRSVKDLGTLIETVFSKHVLASVEEHIDTRTASGRLILNILASVSQWEREAIGERTKAVKEHLKKNSKYLGGAVPYGYDVRDGYLVPNTEEQRVIAQARELRASGIGYASIGKRLDTLGLRNRKHSTFNSQQVKRLVA